MLNQMDQHVVATPSSTSGFTSLAKAINQLPNICKYAMRFCDVQYAYIDVLGYIL